METLKLNSAGIIILFLTACNTPAHQKTAANKMDHSPVEAVSPKNQYLNDSVKENSVHYNTLKNGIDFKATGNEPFWLLEIDADKFIHFKALNGYEIKTPVSEGAQSADANVTRYRSITGQGELIVQIAQQECINDMSGKKSDYSVSINIKNDTDIDYTTYKGCGEYFADYRINDIWILESINDKPLDKKYFIKVLPRLEINLAQKKVFGHGGCNNFTGYAEVMGKKIKFGHLAGGTAMVCDNMEFESHYLKGLSLHSIPYFITPGKLHLKFNADSVFVYKKTD